MNPAIARKRRAKAQAMENTHRKHDHPHSQDGGQEINVGQMERQASMFGGGLLAAYGLTRGSLTGLALAAIGGALLWRGYTGHCQMYQMLGHSTADKEQIQPQEHSGGHQAAHPQGAV